MSEDFKINGKSFDFSQVSKNGVKKDKSIEDNSNDKSNDNASAEISNEISENKFLDILNEYKD